MDTQDDEAQFQGAFKIIDNQQDAGNLPEVLESLFDQELIRERRSLLPSTGHAIESAFQELDTRHPFFHLGRPQKRSPPLNIVSREKLAELYPSDSDQSSFSMAAQSTSSGSALSISRPLSMQSGYSDHLNMSGIGGSHESIDLAIEQGKKNSSKIENIQKGTSRRALRMKDVTSELRNRMTGLEHYLELSQRDMEDRFASKVDQLEQKVCRWIGKEEEYSDSRSVTTKHLPQSMNSCLSWVVPYSYLKRRSQQSIVSPELKLPWLQGLTATLYLKGVGKGHGSHLSIGFSWPKKGENPKVDESYPVNVTVKIINQEDASESIEKRLILDTCQEDGGSSAQSSNLNTSIPKLIPISTVEDTSLGYLSDGSLLINISIEDILA